MGQASGTRLQARSKSFGHRSTLKAAVSFSQLTHQAINTRGMSTIEEHFLAGNFRGCLSVFSALELQDEEQSLNASSYLDLYFYTTFLACYLIVHELPNAKYLWKRAPGHLKATQSGSMLSEMWEVGKAMWKEDLAAAITRLGSVTWPEQIRPWAAAVQESIVRRHVTAVSTTYTQIPAASIAQQLGISAQRVMEEVTRLGWKVDGVSGLLLPVAQAGGSNLQGAGAVADVDECSLLLRKATEIAAHLGRQPIRTETKK